MDDEMNASEVVKQVTEEKQLLLVLNILNECKDLEEAKMRVKALLGKYSE